MKKRQILALATLALLAAPIASFANEWSSACSVGATMDKFSLVNAKLQSTPTSSLSFLPIKVGTITARYSVTNTAVLSTGLGTETPDWTTLQLGFTDLNPSGSVIAILYSVQRCSGVVTEICRTPPSHDGLTACEFCTFPSGTIDFSGYLYFVEVTMTRTADDDDPGGGLLLANTLKII